MGQRAGGILERPRATARRRDRAVNGKCDPEVALMLRVQRDEPGAFAEMVERYWPKVFGRLHRLLANRQDAEDLAQDVFLRLYRARKRYQPTAKFNTWLYHIAHNVARNALRSQRRRPSVRFSALSEFEVAELITRSAQGDGTDNPARPLERLELAGVVRAAVSGLGERQRRALVLHQFHCHTYAQIAEQLDMSPKAAKSLLYRARHQLRHSLSKYVNF
jgi:RNA polymerase sigma-70 factor (ECF subfamily)